MSTQRVVIMVDKSGSMAGEEQYVTQAFNEQVQTIKDKARDMEVLVTLITFNHDINFDLFDRPADSIQEMKPGEYVAMGGTAFRDAIGAMMDRFEEEVGEDAGDFLVILISDGWDTSSKKYDQATIAERIQMMDDRGWTFTYLGLKQDVNQVREVARALNIAPSNAISVSGPSGPSGPMGSEGFAAANSAMSKGVEAYFVSARTSESNTSGVLEKKKAFKGFYGDKDAEDVKVEMATKKTD